jgi:hypothetical protein
MRLVTLRGSHGRLSLPPQVAPAEGLPEGVDAPLNQSREAHHPARSLHSPEGHAGGVPRESQRARREVELASVRDSTTTPIVGVSPAAPTPHPASLP